MENEHFEQLKHDFIHAVDPISGFPISARIHSPMHFGVGHAAKYNELHEKAIELGMYEPIKIRSEMNVGFDIAAAKQEDAKMQIIHDEAGEITQEQYDFVSKRVGFNKKIVIMGGGAGAGRTYMRDWAKKVEAGVGIITDLKDYAAEEMKSVADMDKTDWREVQQRVQRQSQQILKSMIKEVPKKHTGPNFTPKKKKRK